MTESHHGAHPVALVAGSATGPALVLDEPLSLWGGFDPVSGLIVERRHPQHGSRLAGTVLFLPHGRGSSSASSVLVEAIRLGTAPVGLVLAEPDEILVLGALVAHELYDIITPVVVAQTPLGAQTGDTVTLDGARVVVDPQAPHGLEARADNDDL